MTNFTEKEQNGSDVFIPGFLQKKDIHSFVDFLGARKETIIRLANLYEKEYFEDGGKIKQRRIMYQQEFRRIKKYFDIAKIAIKYEKA